jgi:hypothetical protein
LADRPDEACPAHVLLNRLFQIIAGISRFDHGAARAGKGAKPCPQIPRRMRRPLLAAPLRPAGQFRAIMSSAWCTRLRPW